MRQWTVQIQRQLGPADLEAATRLARWRWGRDAGVVSYDGGALVFLGADAPWVGPEFAQLVERGELEVPKPRGRKVARKKRGGRAR